MGKKKLEDLNKKWTIILEKPPKIQRCSICGGWHEEDLVENALIPPYSGWTGI